MHYPARVVDIHNALRYNESVAQTSSHSPSSAVAVLPSAARTFTVHALALASQNEANVVRMLDKVLAHAEAWMGETVPPIGKILESIRHGLQSSDHAFQLWSQTTAAYFQALPITGYDTLTANQVVQSLHGLTAEELQAVRQYEANHKNRTSVLRALDARQRS